MKLHSDYSGFALAINDEAMLDLLKPKLKTILGGIFKLSNLHVTRVFPRKDGGLTIQYEITLKNLKIDRERKRLVCGHLLAPFAPWPDYIGNTRGNVIMLDDLRLVLPIFPFDTKLPNLAKLLAFKKGSIIPNLLGSSIYAEGELGITNYEILGYRLEKRCVIRYALSRNQSDKNTKKIIIKAMRPSAAARSAKNFKNLQENGFHPGSEDRLTTPEIYKFDDKLGAIFMEDAPGLSLHFLLDNVILPDSCKAAGKILQKLHSLDVNDLKAHTKQDELGNINRNIELMGYMFPKFEIAFKEAFAALEELTIKDADKPVVSHRDFYDKQVLYSENRTTLIDCDNIAMADPALDYGNFVAHMTLRKLQHPESSTNIDNGLEAFRAGYNQINENIKTNSHWWTAATLLRLATLYILRPRWHDLTPELLRKFSLALGHKNTEV